MTEQEPQWDKDTMERTTPTGGQILRYIRRALDLSVRGVAEKSGISRDAVNKLENGEKAPTLDEIKPLADTFNIEPIVILKAYGVPVPTVNSSVYEKKVQDLIHAIQIGVEIEERVQEILSHIEEPVQEVLFLKEQ